MSTARGLRATRDPGGHWHLRRADDLDDSAPRVPPSATSAPLGREVLLAWHRALRERDWTAALEWPKALGARGEQRAGRAEALARACAEAAREALSWRGEVDRTLLLDTRRALARRGLAPMRQASALRRGAAWGLAMATWAACSLRLPWRGDRLGALSRWAVLHGETSTRTRHLLALCRTGTFDAIFLVGRPGIPLSRLMADWRPRVPGPLPPVHRIGRGLDALQAALRSAVAAWRLLAEEGSAPLHLPLRELAALAFRAAWGEVLATAWRRRGQSGGEAWFGHTGTADVDALEQAMRSGGATTLHLVHGVSVGLPFVARSDLAWFRSAADARWHRALGGYGRCLAPPAEPVLPAPRGTQLLVVGNLAHPMNPAGAEAAVREEAAVLAAARDAAGPAVPACWRPHPAFVGLPAAQQHWLLAQAAHLGFRRSVEGQALIADLLQARWVVCTPSTMLLELLLQGQVPVLWAGQSLAPESVPGAYPVRAGNAADLAAAFAALDDDDRREALREQALHALGPARAPRPGEALAEDPR